MANATMRVAKAFRSALIEQISHSYLTLTAPLQLYTGAMIGLNAAGYLAKFDDTASFRFFGIILDKDGNPKIPSTGAASGTAGDGTLDVDVKQPAAFELAITSVAITDIGRNVYALDDQTGTLDPTATTFGNRIGVVKDLVYATNGGSAVANIALVKPIYEAPNGNPLLVYAANAAVTLKHGATAVITKGSAAALTIADPTTGVHDGLEMDFISATAFAHTLVAPSGFNGAGTQGLWGGAKGDGMKIIAYLAKWYVKYKTNVTLS